MIDVDFIRTAGTETTHALDGHAVSEWKDGRLVRRGRTWCGKIVTGRTGATIASGIDCGTCRRSMRREGYTA